jgi:hypothetical protein
MEKDKIFFGESGLTSTSANHIANLAKEWIQTIESEINSTNLYDVNVSLVDTSNTRCTQHGNVIEDLEKIPTHLEMIGLAKSLVAWLREAIKARQRLVNEVEDMNLDEYCRLNSIELDGAPIVEKYLTADEAISELSVKERNRYYMLETLCATIGKYIHPDGWLSEKRKDLNNVLTHPCKVKGEGHDMVIYDYVPTVKVGDVDAVFFGLQKKHRELQAELNSIKFKIEQKCTEDKIAKKAKYDSEFSKWHSDYEKVHNALQTWKLEEVKRISSLKIIIPNELKSVYEAISSLGKKD